MRFTPALRFFRKNSPPGDGHDPADLGTAFGMEASLEGEPAGDSQPQLGYPLESEQLAAQLKAESPLAWLSQRKGKH